MAADTCTRFPRISITSLKSHELKGFWSIKTWSAAQDFFTSKPSPGWFTVWGTILKGETFQKALRFRYICCTSPLHLLYLTSHATLPKPHWVQSQISINSWHFSRELKGGIFEVHRAMAIQLGYKLDTQHTSTGNNMLWEGNPCILGLTVTFT